nr:hypothetical protein BaRGS_029310 [Batillaria attramentaria]
MLERWTFNARVLTLWDTAGVERFRTLTRNYYRNTHAALLVFSLDDPTSLFYLPRWEKDVMESAPDAVKFLVGNKGDLDRMVTKVSMQNFAAAHGCQAAFLTSAQTGEGVEEALTALCEYLVTKHQHQGKMADSDRAWMLGSGLHVHNGDEHEKKTCCG